MARPYLGKALTFPIDNDFAPISGPDLVLQDIQLLLLTSPGERVMRPNFGCGITARVWDNLESVSTDGAFDIAAAIREFEPRVILQEVVPTIDRANGLVLFNIRMVIIDGQVQANLIFPFKPVAELSIR
jgi:phage baseplate assembly protein W